MSYQEHNGQDTVTAEDWMVPGVTLAITEHRRRIATLMGRLDGLRRQAVEEGVAALEDGTVDAATLVSRFSERLRASDGQLRAVVDELETRRVARLLTQQPRTSEI